MHRICQIDVYHLLLIYNALSQHTHAEIRRYILKVNAILIYSLFLNLRQRISKHHQIVMTIFF